MYISHTHAEFVIFDIPKTGLDTPALARGCNALAALDRSGYWPEPRVFHATLVTTIDPLDRLSLPSELHLAEGFGCPVGVSQSPGEPALHQSNQPKCFPLNSNDIGKA